VLAEHGRPVLQLHLTDHDAGLRRITEALTSLAPTEGHA
jgi:glucose-6-phosphate isomerase